MRGIITMIRKEFRQMWRDPAMLRIIFAAPLIQLLVLSYAANFDLKRVKLTILDQDHSAMSRRLADSFFTSEAFVPGPPAAGPAELERQLLHQQTGLTLWIPNHYSQNIARGRPAQLGLAVDGTNSRRAARAAGYAAQMVQREAARLRQGQGIRNSAPTNRLHQVRAQTRFFYNPELSSQHYMVPGIVVLLVTILSTMLSGMAVVREKEIGTLEQLMVTPLSSLQVIAGKLIPYAIVSYAAMTVATFVAILWFGLPFEGSLLTLPFCMGFYLVVTLGGGLLASTVSHTQQQAMLTIWFFLTSGIMTSGFFYPIENMPAWAQTLTLINPMRYIMTIVRGIFLKGAGLRDVAGELAALLVIGSVTLAAAVARFQKRLA